MLQLLYQSLMTQLSTPPAAEQPGPQVFNSVHYKRALSSGASKHVPVTSSRPWGIQAESVGNLERPWTDCIW